MDSHRFETRRKLIAKLARKRPSPLARGDLRIWAAAAIYAVGSINFLFDSSQDIFMTGDQISLLTGVPKSTLSNKAKQIRDSLKLYQIHPNSRGGSCWPIALFHGSSSSMGSLWMLVPCPQTFKLRPAGSG